MTGMIRPIRVEGNFAFVSLTKGKEAMIDLENVPLVAGRNWTALPGRNTFYAYRREGPRQRSLVIMLHRLIMGDPIGMDVDHIDGNGLNNLRDNLRLATKSQNLCNSRLRNDSKSGVKGVGLHKASGKWRAQIGFHGKQRHLGLFTAIEDAAAAYSAASAEFHGEFGRTS